MKITTILTASGLLGVALLFTAFSSKTSIPTEKVASEKGESFLEFLSYFPKTDLPYSIGLKDFKGYAPYQNGSAPIVTPQRAVDYSPISQSKFMPEEGIRIFSREGPPVLQPVARFYPNEKMVAVVYSSKRPFHNDLLSKYYLLLYDLKGKFIPASKDKSQRMQAFPLAASAYQYSSTCFIDANGYVWINRYDNQWKKDVRKTSYANNQLVDFALAETKVFKMGAGGVTETNDYPTASRASKD